MDPVAAGRAGQDDRRARSSQRPSDTTGHTTETTQAQAPVKEIPPGAIHGGSGNTYSHYGCRCELCRAAHNKRMQRRRMERFAITREHGLPAHVKHGGSAYRNWGCRCPVCTKGSAEMNRPAMQRYHERQKAKAKGS